MLYEVITFEAFSKNFSSVIIPYSMKSLRSSHFFSKFSLSFLKMSASLSVITSYSRHYTKLYDWWKSDDSPVSDNKVLSTEAWEHCRKIAAEQLSAKKLYVVDCFSGANKETRLCVRFVMEVAWQAHFVKNMFIRPTEVV